jgi:transposase-like protein
MTASVNTECYKTHRLPDEIIRHGVWLSSRFTLSYRDMQELLCKHGITVSHAALRQWCRKFGQDYAHQLCRQRPRPGDKGHLDEVSLTMNGQRHYWGQAVDQDNNVLDILVQSRRNKQAAKKVFRKVLKGLQYVPRVVITDKLKSYGAAKREILPGREANPPGRRSVFCRRMAPWPDTSARDGICYPCLHPVQRAAAIRAVGGDDGHGAGCQRDRVDRGRLPLCLVTILASIS